MAKSKEKNKALELRQRGESIKDIAKKLKIAKSTVSLWCRDINLTSKQIERLHKKMIYGSYKGRLKGARVQYKRRIQRVEEWKKRGIKFINRLSNRDLLIAGIALYWGEGAKKKRSVSFSNSDEKIINFMIKFFRKLWKIDKNRFVGYIGVNKIHKKRIEDIENYWSKTTKIPREQFTKTTLIKAKNKKNYKNFPVHYGTFTFKIRKSAELYYQINGLIEGLMRAKLSDK
ncbi:MAG: hypothetical protein FJZ05_02260 [Candidatus Nealsonbacteria bacterium]|nr:hypothetical protein [Candidatus Nealsonbacteria bacterium]